MAGFRSKALRRRGFAGSSGSASGSGAGAFTGSGAGAGPSAGGGVSALAGGAAAGSGSVGASDGAGPAATAVGASARTPHNGTMHGRRKRRGTERGVPRRSRAIKGEGWYDRILAGNSFSTQIILLISVYFFASGYPEYVDIALLYALINYVGTLALMNYFRSKRHSGGRHS